MSLAHTEFDTFCFNQNPVPMLVFNRGSLQILKANEAAVEKYGYSAEEFLEMSVKDIRPAEDIPLLLNNLDATDQKLKGPHFRHQKKNGDIFYVQVTSRNFAWGDINGQLAVVHDVSEEVEAQIRAQKAEEEAREERKFSSQLIKNLPDAFWLMDNEGNVVDWNKQVEQVSGFSKKEIRKGDVFDFFAEEERAGLRETLGKAFLEGKATAEATLITKTGEQIPYALTGIKFTYRDETYISGVGVNIQAQKNQQKKLEKSKLQLGRAQQIAKMGSWEMMFDDMQLHWSDQMYELFGLSKENFTVSFENFLELVPGGERDKLQQDLNDAMAGEMDEAIEHRIITSEGEIRHVVERGEVDCDADGTPVKVSGTMQDVTERKTTEKELEKNRSNLKRAQQIAQVGSFEWDVVNNEIDYSAEACNIYGIENLAAEKPEIDQFVSIIHPADREFVNEQMDGILNGNGFEEFEHRLRTSNGAEKHVVQRGDVEYADDGSAVKVFGTVQDITHQKEIESELLRRSKAIDSSMDGISIFDADNRIVYLNKAFAHMYGYDSVTELEGESWEKLYSKEKINYFENEVLPKVEKYGEWRDEDTAKRKDGSIFPKEFTFSKVEGGGLICICRDITERKKGEQRIEKSLQEKDVLLAEIHHRVKNNLAIISGLLKLEAMSHEDDTLLSQAMHESQLRIQSMAMIHEKLYQTANFTNLRFKNYISELVETISDTMNMRDKDVSINIDSDDIKLNINYAIPCALIINEMVTNAFKYAFNERGKGVLDIKLKRRDDVISLVVHDNGPGLPDNFEEESGDSLGYVLLKQLTKQLHGELKVKNNKGAYFKVTFRDGEKSGSSSNMRFANQHQT